MKGWRIVRKGWIKKSWEGVNEWMKNSEKRMNEEMLGRDKWRIVRKGWMKTVWEVINEWIKTSEKRMTEERLGKDELINEE